MTILARKELTKRNRIKQESILQANVNHDNQRTKPHQQRPLTQR